jgi:hypothetical protein
LLPFLAYPKRYTEGPIAQAELSHLRKTESRHRWLRPITEALFALACGAAMIPFVTFVSGPKVLLLIIMAVAIYSFQLWVVLRTLMLASVAIAREKTLENWENLILTGLDARQIVLSQWWAIIRYTWREYFVAALLRIVLAYGFAQYCWSITAYTTLSGFEAYTCPVIMKAFCYGTSPAIGGNPPELLKVVAAVIATMTYSFVEAALIIAIGLFAALMLTHYGRVVLGLVLRVSLLLAGIGLTAMLSNQQHTYDGKAISFEYYAFYGTKLSEAVQVTASSLVDSGTLLAADLMRLDSENGRVFHTFRTLASAAAGLTIYTFMIWLFLRLAQMIAVRQNALRPGDR